MSTNSTFADIQQYEAGHTKPARGLVKSARLRTIAILKALRRHQRHRKAMRDLQALDHRMLKDIGLERSEIFRAVQGRYY